MKNLSRTIDQILKVMPDLGGCLIPIKDKYQKYPRRKISIWKEMIETLNSKGLQKHPRWGEIKNIVTSERRMDFKPRYSFSEVQSTEHIIGNIPENISDRIKRHDLQSIRNGKVRYEALETRNTDLLALVIKKDALLEIQIKKIWVELKDHFHLWNREIYNTFFIRNKLGMLVLVSSSLQMPSPHGPAGMMIQMNPDMLRKFLEMFGMNPPLGMPPDL